MNSNTPPGWMVRKVARIIRNFSDNLTISEKANIEGPFYDLLFRACGQIMGEATAFPEAGKMLPSDLIQALHRAPAGNTISQLERVSIIILDHDATRAANALKLSTRPQDMPEFIALKCYCLSWLLEGGRE